MDNNIQEIRRKRFQYLQKLYEITEGSELVSVNFQQVGDELGFSHSEADRIDDYLVAEGLIEPAGLGGEIGITHRGIVEVESALSKPDEPTKYFPPVNFIHVEQMIGSQIQQGTNQSSQVFTYSANDYEAITEFIAELKNQFSELKLDAETKAEVEADIATIKSQIKSPRPKSIVIRECLASLRKILESVASSIIAASLLSHISALIR